jgi:hypothetical protein
VGGNGFGATGSLAGSGGGGGGGGGGGLVYIRWAYLSRSTSYQYYFSTRW